MEKKKQPKNIKQTGIKAWPVDDRPREKLLKKGASSLSDSELLAILFRTGTRGVSAVDLARKVIMKFKTFQDMSHTDARDWKEFKGLGNAKIAHIQAALEIGKRFREDKVKKGKQKIKSAKDIVEILMPQMRDRKTEVFKLVHLDSNNRIIDIEDAAIGTVNHAMPIVREIIHSALQKFAVSIICAHNHPSG
ncbi:MAG: DNA repair protein RadC, partial [Candidatus Omnitrophota bacterium]